MKNNLLTGFILALLLSGCSAPKEENAKADEQQKQFSNYGKSTIGTSQRR